MIETIKKKGVRVRQQEDISGIDSKVRHLWKQQEEIKRKVALIVVGLFVTSILTIINIIFSSYLFSHLNEVDKNLKELQKTDKSPPTSNPTPTPSKNPSTSRATSSPQSSPSKEETGNHL